MNCGATAWPPVRPTGQLGPDDAEGIAPVARAEAAFPQTEMAIFPRACPCVRYRMAWGTSASGYVRSMTGAIFPDSMSSVRTIRSR